jgi:hypothetical protein
MSILRGKIDFYDDAGCKYGFDSRCPLIIIRSALFLCDGFLTFAEPRYVFGYYSASLHKCA